MLSFAKTLILVIILFMHISWGSNYKNKSVIKKKVLFEKYQPVTKQIRLVLYFYVTFK